MSTTLIVEAYGRLTPIAERVAPDPESPQDVREYLWGAFHARSALMGWSASDTGGPSRLWNVEEAELTYPQRGDGSSIGFAQVGLDVNPATALESHVILDAPPDAELLRTALPSEGWAPVPTNDDAGSQTDPVVAIPPLVQCLDDSLRWFGEVEVSAVQVTGYDLEQTHQDSPQYHLEHLLAWFIRNPSERVQAVVTLAVSPQDDRDTVLEILSHIHETNSGRFEVGPLVSALDGHAAGDDVARLRWSRCDTAIAVTMPEWSTAAAGWLLGRVFGAALSLDPAPFHLSFRVTRIASQ